MIRLSHIIPPSTPPPITPPASESPFWRVHRFVVRFSAHGGNTVDRGGHVAVGVGRRLTGVLQELEVRTGAGQSAVEGRLQGHRDQ